MPVNWPCCFAADVVNGLPTRELLPRAGDEITPHAARSAPLAPVTNYVQAGYWIFTTSLVVPVFPLPSLARKPIMCSPAESSGVVT
jgi:hypothetical protein